MELHRIMAKETILTPEGRQKLEDELHYLETEKRAEVGERIRIARDFGDISENSEYDDAKNEQGLMEARIAEINQILANSTIVESPAKRSKKASIGSTVTLVTPEGRERVLTVVGSAEADPAAGRISNESPVGAAVIGHKKGDTIVTEGPTGRKLEFTLTKIENN
jgi:transcription elongation factor GreA